MFWVLLGIGLIVWAMTVLFDPSKKHKNYTLTDQNEATHRARGGNRPPDSSDVVPPASTRNKSH